MTQPSEDLPVRFICAATPKYAEYAARWLLSMQEGGFEDVHVVQYRDLGDWDLNCLLKPLVLREYLSHLERGINVIMDADCVLVKDRADVLQDQILSWKLRGVEVALHRFPDRINAGMKRGMWYSAGFIYLHDEAWGFLNVWCDHANIEFQKRLVSNTRDLNEFPEQYAMALAVIATSDLYKHADVDVKFNCRPPDPTNVMAPFDQCPEPVIIHLPASRKMYREVNREE